MQKSEIVKLLQNGFGEVYFTKADGTDREMYCTLQPMVIQKRDTGKVDNKSIGDNEEVVRVWDIEANDWRSFRIDSIYEMWVEGDLIIPEPVKLSVEEADLAGLDI